MPNRGDVFFQGGIYHIYNRGSRLFISKSDYLLCQNIITSQAKKIHIKILAFCLMPNHYHFLVQQNGDHSVSTWIGKSFNSYVQIFNQKYNRKGPLFESRFKHIEVDKEEYLVTLCRYIHLNPVNAGLVENAEEWEFSDYRDWIAGNNQGTNHYFEGSQEYRSFVENNLVSIIPDRLYVDE